MIRRRRAVAALAVGLVVMAPIPALLGVASAASSTVRRGRLAALPVAPAGSPAAVVTPLLSARRLPATVAGFDQARSLRSGLPGIDAALPAPSCYAVHIGGQSIGSLRADAAVLPASNLKLVTGAVALDVLGEQSRLSTRLVSAAATTPVVAGDLTLVGGGDPLLSTDDYLATLRAEPHYVQADFTRLEVLADRVKAAGIVRIEGSIAGDDSRYDAQRTVSSWPASYAAAPFQAGPLSALMVNDGYVTYRGDNQGTIALDPAVQAAQRLTELLRARGVEVAKPARRAVAPSDAHDVVAPLESAPVSAVVAEMLGASDNDTAELLLKELGHAAGSQGSTASGLAKVASTLAGWSVPLAGYHQTDGSGLDRGDRVTCGLLVAIIDRSLGGSLVDGLPVAATSGTLSDQFVGSAVAGRLRAKTGTLTGARSLSGELPTEGGIVVTFSWVYNGATDSTAWQKARDAFVKVLASFPDAFDPGPYQPAPPRAATP